ncbi:hypothetical protein CcaverHIS002_0200200 [Cutaneotrichosporon cavernicola]|uniref:Rhodanese domain-containing protein n=1 Tax=Cutaneotrichosporon cavernicola TaxID=279322 RepID=A0AA48IET5_9TREE|nr:uncharacterized protein CcaverHIS019_0200250 [Cutaneotrichosporon cavernicola]BEI80860.1 hypothetical protein CcaverHIS002_0200200 [Cutaneotrichosporon cavernicola]BEI88663.1 hypothetical protein CcaverHIS019_0200250 [Cutaneotrichosporon cavernicola]BEI96437.1 hypothetical protein CcaverHIS631_0200260 [Cutaneotrichosporon cavernicola]BEJ04209.1 hypothetical protein CcaverHIS641_0200260 [Cutaneotrichosporon cavernicola]
MFDPHAEQPLLRPFVTAEDALAVARTSYSLDGSVKELGSNQDRNFLLTTSGPQYLLKFDNDAFSTSELEAQNDALLHLSAAGISGPTPIRDNTGAWISSATVNGRIVRVRLLSFVQGESLVSDGHFFPSIISRLGGLAGRVAASLSLAPVPLLERDLQWDMRNAMTVIEAYAPSIADEPRRTAVLAKAREAWPLVTAHNLPVQMIHGDITDDNVVGLRDTLGRVRPETVIDWGDLSAGWRVAELAVTLSCIMHHNRGHPLDAMPAVAAFDKEVKLTDAELAALWPLVVLRGAVVVASGAHQLALEPDNTYVAERVAHEWHIFDTSAQLDFKIAHAAVRAVTRRPDEPAPKPKSQLLDTDVEIEYVRLDSTSPHLHRGVFLAQDAEERVIAEVVRSGKVPAFAYSEPRLTRTTTPGFDAPETTPLFFAARVPPGTQLRAPFSGQLKAGQGEVSLLGAFGRIIFGGVTGTSGAIAAGKTIGRADGDVTVQWLRPGTASAPAFVDAAALPAWQRLTFDPAPLLGMSPANWLSDVEEERMRRDDVTPSAAERYYELPPGIERGWREVLYDTAGRGYLDMVNNVAGVGHGHPRMADAVAQQLLTLNTNNRFLYSSLAEYVERLRDLAPDPSLSAVLLVNSGSEAVELALKLALAHTGRRDVVVLREGYHGWTAASDAVSTSAFDNPTALGNRPAHVHVAEAVNLYRNPKSAEEYAAGVKELLTTLDSAGTPAGAFISEPVFGNGGGVVYPAGYLKQVYAAVRASGGLCIADEVQVGLGRLGHHAWGVHEQGVVPDIVAVAKALGNAYPLGAVYTTPAIAASLAREGMFFSSAGGATASGVAGLAVLDIMRDEGLQANAAAVGDFLAERFEELMRRHPVIGCVHGMGLYQGVELVRDRESKEPAASETAWVCERMLDYGVIIQPTSERQNVLKIKPPLTLTREHADVFVSALDAVLGELEQRMRGREE